jgi:hypothetical protein
MSSPSPHVPLRFDTKYGKRDVAQRQGRGNEFTFKVNKKAAFSSRPFLLIQRNKKAVEPSRGPPRPCLYGKGSAVGEPLLDRPPPIIAAIDLFLHNHNDHNNSTFID